MLFQMNLPSNKECFQEMLGTGGGKDSVCTREFMAEKMKCVCSVEDVVTTRWYTRQ